MTAGTRRSGQDAEARDIQISLREARLVVERLLVVAGMAIGRIPAVRDYMIDAECMGLGALARLRDDFDRLRSDSRQAGLGYVASDSAVARADAGGRSGLVIGPDVADLAAGLASRRGIAVLTVTGVRDPRFLEAACASGPRHGVSMCVLTGTRPQRMAVSAGESWAEVLGGHPAPPSDAGWQGQEQDDREGSCVVLCADIRRPGWPDEGRPGRPLGPLLRRALDEGFTLDEDLWWWLYRESGQALTPDSALSRRHTGASVLDAHGNIMGEIGEDWDEEEAG